MLADLQRYHRPRSIEEAWMLLKSCPGQVRLLGGGTRLLAGDTARISDVVDLQSVPLREVSRNGFALRLGAGITLQQLWAMDPHPTGSSWSPLLRQAVLLAQPSWMLRNRSTLAGEILCGGILAAALMVLDGQIEYLEGSEGKLHRAAYDDSFPGGGDSPRLLTAIDIPLRLPGEAADVQYVSTMPKAVPLLAAAVFLRRSGSRLQSVRIALYQGRALPQRLTRVESLLQEQEISHAEPSLWQAVLEESWSPVDDLRASAGYRREVAPVLLSRALAAAWKQTDDDQPDPLPPRNAG